MNDEFTFGQDNRYCITVKHNGITTARLKRNNGRWYCMASVLMTSFEMCTIADKLDELNVVKK